ncbi:tRNA lysidine(34) synthetase TilS [Yoonia sp. 208BN28-4]|uniref:tRNA lysidine(34) synthetase TilS n=1 Tax=Yoonia sp. 208BN28-4 TaxID=3126505 RepID=UPI00309CE632
MSGTAALQARFAATIQDHLDPDPPLTLGVAVSGGGDSMALLELVRHWAQGRNVSLRAVTVDHKLRDVTGEVALVARYCATHGLPHDVLSWAGWDQQGNLQDSARTARRDLIAQWAADHSIALTLYGHTADDQAETLLMRLSRGSGVDGLAGIAARPAGAGLLRPLLAERRQDLRAYLREADVPWAEDPSNDDLQFDRIKARRMMVHLSELGLTTDRLLATAAHMQRARTGLQTAASDFARQHVRGEAGDLIFAPDALHLSSGDAPARVLTAAMMWMTGQTYRPRYDALTRAVTAVQNGEQRTLSGVVLRPDGDTLRMIRELAAIRAARTQGRDKLLWDHRWQITPPDDHNKIFTVQALGDAIRHVHDWRECGLSRQTLMTTPAIFDGDTLIAAPVAGYSQGWTARIVADFHSSLVSH